MIRFLFFVVFLLSFSFNSHAENPTYTTYIAARDACYAAVNTYSCGYTASATSGGTFYGATLTHTETGIKTYSPSYCSSLTYGSTTTCSDTEIDYYPECPAGTTENPTTNYCEPDLPECQDKQGQVVSLSYTGINNAPTCDGGCAITLSGVHACTNTDNDLVYCFGNFTHTGQICTGSGNSQPPIPKEPAEDAEKQSESSSSDGSHKETHFEENGNERITTETETHPDGSQTVNKEIERDNGDGTSTTTRIETRYGPNGEPESISATQETTGLNAPGADSGEGSDENGNSANSSAACNQPPVCDGDPIQCAILRQQWETMCVQTAEVQPTDDCVNTPACDGDPLGCQILIDQWRLACSYRSGFESLSIDAESYFTASGNTDLDTVTEGSLLEQVGTTDTDIQTEVGSFLDFTATSGTCPQPQSVNLGQFGSVEFSYQLFCDLASTVRWVVLLAASMVGGSIVMRSLAW